MIKSNEVLTLGKKYLAILLFVTFTSPLYAVDYSEMSTQELIAIMGYVKKKNKKKFINELSQRVPTMNSQEKVKYNKNLKKIKNK